MTLQDIQHTIGRSLAEGKMTPRQVFKQVISLYLHHRVEKTHLDKDGDMLIFQWVTYDWGQGTHVELEFTRQIIVPELFEDDGNIWEEDVIIQLRTTCQFPPTAMTQQLGEGNMWCQHPSYIAKFEVNVFNTACMKRLGESSPEEVQIEISPA